MEVEKIKLNQGEKAYMQMPIEIKTIDKEVGTLYAIFSTQDVDRHGDVVFQNGWDLINYKDNPVILNSHNHGDATEVIGKASDVKVEKNKLQGKITFAINENPKAKVIFDLYAGGFLNAFSVGFIPKKFKENKDGTVNFGVIEEAELLEVSAVSVPANARALAKAKGIDTDILSDHNQEIENYEQPKHDEVSEGIEVPPVDEPKLTTDSDNSESGSEINNEESGEDVGDQTDGDNVSDEEFEGDTEEDIENKKIDTATAQVIKAIYAIEAREKEHYKKVAEIIDSLLRDTPHVNIKTREQIRKRKTNQAIRMLLKIK